MVLWLLASKALFKNNNNNRGLESNIPAISHWAADKIKSKYNDFTTWGNPWDRHCFDTAYMQTPVEVYPYSHWAPVPAKILSHLGCFTERSCFVTQGETDGEEANTEMSLVCVIFIAFSLFSPLHGLSDSLCVYTVSPCMWVALDPPLPSLSSFHQPSLLHDPIYYWNQSSTPPPHAPKTQAQAQPRPRDPCPHHGSWIMYGGIQWDEGFATAPTVTYITPVALSIPCDLPVCGQMYPHVYTQKLHVLPKDNTISEMCRY